MIGAKFLFSSIEVTKQVFYRSPLSFAIVNLKPIVPGHVLMVPSRSVPRISDLNDSELASLLKSVQTVGRVIERVYGADALTVACQDGKAAGQSIPHVHFHILPRKAQGDRFTQNDDVYPALEKSESGLPDDLKSAQTPATFKVDADENRLARSMEEMAREAEWLQTFFEEQK